MYSAKLPTNIFTFHPHNAPSTFKSPVLKKLELFGNYVYAVILLKVSVNSLCTESTAECTADVVAGAGLVCQVHKMCKLSQKTRFQFVPIAALCLYNIQRENLVF